MIRLRQFVKVRHYATSAKLEYDAIVIGGGSGGLAFSKEASDLGARVALIDAVHPSPHGTTWGIGGTCANVGCIPKKLMHLGALIGKDIKNSSKYGWINIPEKPTLDWNVLSSVVNDRIKANNWIYRVQLNEKKIKYYNGAASFIDSNSIKVVTAGKKPSEVVLIAPKVVIASGLRPKYPSIPGASFGITSDDVFTLKNAPGRCLIVGAGYIALETAGFLNGIGFPVDVLIRSQPLKEFDRDCVRMITENLSVHGVNLIQGSEVSKVEKDNNKLKVSFTEKYGPQTYDTVMWAIGREPCLADMNIEAAHINLSKKSKIFVNELDETSTKGVFAIGDIAEGKPELTPTAILSGKYLAKRLFADSKKPMKFDKKGHVPTTIFGPLEFGTVGLSEEQAINEFGEEKIEVYHSHFVPFEYIVPQDEDSAQCYAKVITMRDEPKTVVGMHIVSPNAAEIIQGYAVAFKKGITFDDLSETIAIHPCTSEEIVKISITKRSGLSPKVKGCCG